MSSPSPSYWCYRCARFVNVSSQNDNTITCPFCDGGFIEQIDSQDHLSPQFSPPPAAMFMITNTTTTNNNNNNHRHQDSDLFSSLRFRRNRRNRLPFNPVVVLRGGAATTTFDLYYDDGTGTGLAPLPENMTEFLMGSGFDRVLEQLSNPEVTGLLSRPENPAASKAAVESMPTLEIEESHVRSESECAICKEEFKLGSCAREMPCKHIYHDDCILPWLSTRNTCPLCRHEMPAADSDTTVGNDNEEVEEERTGMAIWRLPGGGFAVGRRGGDREVPGVYTEMDGGGGANGFSWVTNRRQRGGNGGGGGGGGLRRVFTSLGSLFRRPNNNSETGHINSTRSLFNRYLQRQNTPNLVLE